MQKFMFSGRNDILFLHKETNFDKKLNLQSKIKILPFSNMPEPYKLFPFLSLLGNQHQWQP